MSVQANGNYDPISPAPTYTKGHGHVQSHCSALNTSVSLGELFLLAESFLVFFF